MTESSRDIERDVEASRASIEHTVDAIRERMSLGQIVDEASRYFRNGSGSQITSRLGEQIRDNPLPLALVGVGLAWLMSGRGQPHLHRGERYDRRYGGGDGRYAGGDAYAEDDYETGMAGGGRSDLDDMWDVGPDSTGAYRGRDAAGAAFGGTGAGADDAEGGSYAGEAGEMLRDNARRASEALGDAADAARSALGDAADTTRNAFGAAASAAGATASGLGHAAGSALRGGRRAYRGGRRAGMHAYGGARDYGGQAVGGARDAFLDVLEREPLVIGAIGIAVGAAIGAMLPRTAIEDRYLGETRDQMMDAAAETAREQLDRAEHVARDTWDAAREEAEAQGLTPGNLGERARSVMEKAEEAAAASIKS